MNSSTSNSNNKTKKYLLGLLVLMVFFLLFDRGLFYLIRQYEKSYYSRGDFEQKFNRYLQGKDFTALIFGTSRTWEGIHPTYIEETFNKKAFKETFQGKGPKYNYYFYQMFKKHAGTPKVVIYGVDYFIYTVQSDRRWMARFKLEDEEKIDYWTTPSLLWKYKHRIDLFTNNMLIAANEKESTEEEKEKADKKQFAEFDKIQNHTGINPKVSKLVKRHPKFHRQGWPTPPGEEGEYFFKLIELLEKDGVTVILVILPDHIGTYHTNRQKRRLVMNLRGLKKKHKNVHLLNYNMPQLFPLKEDRFFLDGGWGQTNSHLSKDGAIELWKRMSKDMAKHFQY